MCGNMRSVGIGVMGLTFALFVGLLQAAGEEAGEKSPQTKCPVMGGTINKDVYVDYQGQRVYFCCPGCPASFQKSPEKYFSKIAQENVLLESVQETCPVSGEAINKEVFTDYKGRRVYFCSQDCVAAFSKNPQKYLKNLQGPGEGNKGGPSQHQHNQGGGGQHQHNRGSGCGGGCG